MDQETVALRAAGHEVHQFERFNDEIQSLPLPKKARVPFDAVWSQQTARSVGRVIDEVGPDVWHVHNIFPLLSASVVGACRGRVPVAMTFHNYRPICPTGTMFRGGKLCTKCAGALPLPALRHGCFRSSVAATVPVVAASMVQRRLFREHVSAFIFLSEAQLALFESWRLPEERCFIKPNLIPKVGGGLPGESLTAPVPLVGFVSRLDEAKGTRVVMEAWDHYRRARPSSQLRLVVAGSGPLEDAVAEWARGHHTVDLLGRLDRRDCDLLIEKCRAVVVASQCPETFGLVVGEGMAAGTPPIAPSHASFPELIEDGVNGLLFPPGDASMLAMLFDRVAEEEDLFAKLGDNAKHTYERRFTPSRNIKMLEAIYSFATGHPTSSGKSVA